MTSPTLMRREINEIPHVVANLIDRSGPQIQRTAAHLRDLDPAVIMTVARGSSDHACTYFKYLCEIMVGVPVASVGPSIASVYDAPLKLTHAASLAISQSGRSPDIVRLSEKAQAHCALSIALTNDMTSPLAAACSAPVDICAGPELSVAATKTFVTSAVAAALLVAHWTQDKALIDAVCDLPQKFARAAEFDWPEFRSSVSEATSFFTIGRGPSLAMANEAALKFKETCQLHAEAYSSAEVLHGPVSILTDRFPVVVFETPDASSSHVAQAVAKLSSTSGLVFATSDAKDVQNRLDHVRTKHPLTDPLPLIVSFYAMIEALARSRGCDPDRPQLLSKVTETT